MSGEHWQDVQDFDGALHPVAEVIRQLPSIVWELRLMHAGDSTCETAAARIMTILDRIFTVAWGDE